MSLYTSVLYYPKIQPPDVDAEVDLPQVDERVKVNEAESLFTEFEDYLSSQLLRNLIPAGKACNFEDVSIPSNTTTPTSAAVPTVRSHASLSARRDFNVSSASLMFSDAPLSVPTPQGMDSLNMDMPNMSELDTTNSAIAAPVITTPMSATPRRSAGRLPPRILPSFLANNRVLRDSRGRNQRPDVAGSIFVPASPDLSNTIYGDMRFTNEPPRRRTYRSFMERNHDDRALADTEETTSDGHLDD